MKLASRSSHRSGFSLLEVLVAMTIFVFSLVAVGHLLNVCSDQVQEARYTNRATQLCQSQMNRVICGEVSLTGQGDTPFDEAPDWSWSIDVNSDSSIPNLWTVTIRVSRARAEGGVFEASLTQMVLDPAAKGTIESSSASGASGATQGGGN